MVNFKKNQNGFTLIEIIIAIVIISIIAFSVMGYYGNSARVIKESNIREKALLLAQKEVEELKVTDWDSISNTSGEVTQISDYGLANYPAYNKNIVVTGEDINSDGYFDIKDITVTINWDNNNHNVTVKTKIAKR